MSQLQLEIGQPPYTFNPFTNLPLHNKSVNTVEHIYDACPKYSELGSFRIIAYRYVSDGSRR